MILIGRYGLGPYCFTEHEFNEVRQVYEYRGVTVYADLGWTDRWTEVFAYIDDGPLWFVADFPSRSWAHAEQTARLLVDEWIEFMMEGESDGALDKPQRPVVE